MYAVRSDVFVFINEDVLVEATLASGWWFLANNFAPVFGAIGGAKLLPRNASKLIIDSYENVRHRNLAAFPARHHVGSAK
jgi:hypothetical protein